MDNSGRKLVVLLGVFALGLNAASAHQSVAALEADAMMKEPQASAELLGSRYEQVRDLFAAGRLPTVAEMNGWRTGRCFTAAAPNTAQNGLLASFNHDGVDGGPLFPENSWRFFPILYNDGSPADYYDTLGESAERDVWALISTERDVAPEARDNSWVVDYSARTTWQVRKSNEYLVQLWTQDGAPNAYCYYFRVVKENTLNIAPPESTTPPTTIPCIVPGLPFPPGCGP